MSRPLLRTVVLAGTEPGIRFQISPEIIIVRAANLNKN